MYWGVEVWLHHSFPLHWLEVNGELHAPQLYPRKKDWIGGWVGWYRTWAVQLVGSRCSELARPSSANCVLPGVTGVTGVTGYPLCVFHHDKAELCHSADLSCPEQDGAASCSGRTPLGGCLTHLSNLNMEATCLPETLIDFQLIVRRYTSG
jgi:hypothetical protein